MLNTLIGAGYAALAAFALFAGLPDWKVFAFVGMSSAYILAQNIITAIKESK